MHEGKGSIVAGTTPEAPEALMLPFAVLLAAIALAPLLIKHHWERSYHWFSIALGLVPVLFYLGPLHRAGSVTHMAHGYLSFMALIGSLYVVTGGIHIGLKGEAKPWTNSAFLLAGALLANVVGATGASMLLIRPWVRLNRHRFAGFHTAFFIFLVCNVGGGLTPMGPPLFLGYLEGVPFWWVLLHCWRPWLLTVVILLACFYVADWLSYRRAPRRFPKETLSGHRLSGLRNLWFLAVILGAVFLKDPPFLREIMMVTAAAVSYFVTPREDHAANEFTFRPIQEVAWLFAGIFATMMPVLDFMERHADALGIHSEMQFFWLTGALSGILDNAPTYLTFLANAFGLASLDLSSAGDMQPFLQEHSRQLEAISLGAVFFGAMTYIGNGPNLMVKSITESAGMRTPDFARYIYRYAAPILLPLFVLVSWLFFQKAMF